MIDFVFLWFDNAIRVHNTPNHFPARREKFNQFIFKQQATGMKTHKKSHSGFTLIELMIVLAMIGLLFIIASPKIIAWLPEYRLKSAMSDLQSNMQKARMIAVKENRSVSIRFDNATPPGFYYFDDNNNAAHDAGEFRVDLSRYHSGVNFGSGNTPNNWTGAPIINVIPGVITFTSRATSNFNSVYLENENQNVCYAVTTSTVGTAKVRKFNGRTW